ncbi:FtsK/SpoIIIE domain-containing protein [Nostocoides sp. Soil756]|uniref:FtsK/SpoIIIE domain-containing protein n=1 Tax=Nostocoides sp. Soil756 TaxID=1736399 RepID=UPI000AB92FE0|nr:FtsK/SpoIIIE domain-containing protein [Tetrasphaera sp. Soil756]
MSSVGRLGWLCRWLWAWMIGHRRMVAAWLAVSVLLSWARGGSLLAWASTGLAVPLGLVGWAWWFPAGYERVIAGPSRRRRWRRYMRRNWTGLAEACGWARVVRDRVVAGSRKPSGQSVPRLRSVRAKGSTVTLVVRARAGQTLDQLEAGVPGLAATLDALSWRCTAYGGSTSTLRVELVMHDALREARDGTVPLGPTSAEPGHLLPLGRRDVGGVWALTVAGRHTLVAGCSGAGKGSVLWGLVAGLAPLVPSDSARLWGIDLKHGVELRMGRALFATVADSGPGALAVLAALLDVAERRGEAMAGQVRAHTPRPGDPLHVLVIDELADLIAYADRETRMEAARLLARLLTKGRALGVVVAAFVQDPRKDVVTMRNLFTQRVALRLLSDQETAMVLGDGATRTAPAHRISPTAPGTAWVVDDEGNTDRVRADYWPDPVIRDLAARYPCRVSRVPTTPDPPDQGDEHETSGSDGPRLHAVPTDEPTCRPRRPRSPRAPRARASADSMSAEGSGSR